MRIIQRRPVPEHTDLPSHLHPVIRRVLAARQIKSADRLDYSLQHLHSWQSLQGIHEAAHLLIEALKNQHHIVIVADYDADGATSCALAFRALKKMGAQQVSFVVPNRERHGYGLTEEIVQLTLPLKPEVLITVDNGIASLEGVAAARAAGIKVLITDHHLVGEQLPEANAIVNPNLPGDAFPSKHLAGVGVIFYVMSALRTHLRQMGWFEQQQIPVPNMASLLDLVALGTVADVVMLDYNNRILVEQGLRRIREDHCCPGIRALVQVAGRTQSMLIASDLSFGLAPRLNAAGRMDDMSLGIACLLSEDDREALQFAQALDDFNQERRFVESEMQQSALDKLAVMLRADKQASLPIGLCLYDADWHQGVIGLVASRVKEQLHRPVIVFADGQHDEIKGSARSVSGVHVRDVLDAVAKRYPTLITRFGGHAMAAGLSLPRIHLADFQAAFDAEVRKLLCEADLHGVVHSDGELCGNDITLELADNLRMLAPWGQGFPEPVFDGEFELLQRRVLKERHLKLWLKIPQSDQTVEAIAFNTLDEDWPPSVDRVRLAYRLAANTFRQITQVQLVAEYVTFIGSG